MKLYNHVVFKMGKHEAEIAPHIPEGGNWQDIPLSISDTRLDKIRETGGRTTYYGRLCWDKPSYTIATYFNRVGNGCNLHPSQCRVLSNREAARLQSFPDSFIFQGSNASQYKQIGNAVPPLLAQVRRFTDHASFKRNEFCGFVCRMRRYVGRIHYERIPADSCK